MLVLALPLLLAASDARGTILRAIPFGDKVEHAESIVVGKCISQTSQVDEGRNWILTHSTFQIEQTLKGAPAQQITIVTPGGTAGKIAQEVVGVPKFRPGDENVLFVRQSTAGPTVLYFEQGAYRVEKNSRGERMVQPMVSAPLVGSARGQSVAPERARTLREFEGEVRRTARDREAQRMEMLERRRREETSLRSRLTQNAPLVVLALLGAMLATWQIYRRW